MENSKIGKSKQIERIFRFLNEDNLISLEEYILTKTKDYYPSFNSEEELLKCFTDSYSTLTEQDLFELRYYSGYNYKNINNALRNTWNYNENGNIETRDQYIQLGNKLSEIIERVPQINRSFKTYRGTDISSFKEYGIKKIEELVNMKGQFMYDSAFISTSPIEDKSFYKKENELGINYNIKIEYLVPDDFNDGIYLSDNASYNPEQQEYLINKGNLSKVLDVSISSDNTTATLKTLLIPKKIYDNYYTDKKVK